MNKTEKDDDVSQSNGVDAVLDTTKKTKKNKSKNVDKSANKHANEPICQHCKWHNNKPSFCRANKTYVARKSTCDKWKKEME